MPHGSGVGEGSRVTLPLFAQHSLQAQCRRLPLGYIMMMLKDLVRLVIQKGDSVLMHGNTARHEFAVGEVRGKGQWEEPNSLGGAVAELKGQSLAIVHMQFVLNEALGEELDKHA